MSADLRSKRFSGVRSFARQISTMGKTSPRGSSAGSSIHEQIMENEARPEHASLAPFFATRLDSENPVDDTFLSTDLSEHIRMELFDDGPEEQVSVSNSKGSSLDEGTTSSPSSTGFSPASSNSGDDAKKIWIAASADTPFHADEASAYNFSEAHFMSPPVKPEPSTVFHDSLPSGSQFSQRSQFPLSPDSVAPSTVVIENPNSPPNTPPYRASAVQHAGRVAAAPVTVSTLGMDIIAEAADACAAAGVPPPAAPLRAPSYLPEYNPEDWANTSNLKYALQLGKVPSKSRVETQIKLGLNIYPPPSEVSIHLPADTISKPKLQLKEPMVPNKSALMLEAVVVCHTNPHCHVDMCKGCINRELKRASRKKVRLPAEEAHWNESAEKRAIVFNCRELVDFGPSVDMIVDGKEVRGRQLEIPMRMACYCRHHNEKIGFRALVVIKDYKGNVVARGATDPIMITDDHKTGSVSTIPSTEAAKPVSKKRKASSDFSASPADLSSASDYSRTASHVRGPSITAESLAHLTSPGSVISEYSTRAGSPVNGFDDLRSLDSGLPLRGSAHSSGVNLALNSGSSSGLVVTTASPAELNSWTNSLSMASPYNFAGQIPEIKRIIPGQGPIRGGIEVTILGTGFVDGIVVKFGDNVSPSTHCWNSTTIITCLPPAQVEGPVNVTFANFAGQEPRVFTYFDDTEKQLIELALQVVGLKMNGRLEDAREIARRIINSEGAFPSELSGQFTSDGGQQESDAFGLSGAELESAVIACLQLMEIAESDFATPLDMSNDQEQTMLHLAAVLGFTGFCSELLNAGAQVDYSDINGFTALHFAAMNNHEDLVALLLDEGADPYIRTFDGRSVLNLAQDEEVLRVLSEALDGDLSERSSLLEFAASTQASRRSSLHPSIASSDHEDLEVQNHSRWNLSEYFSDLRDNARNSANGFWRRRGNGERPVDDNFWNYFIPERLIPVSPSAAEAPSEDTLPPAYEEIFPEGSTTAVDYTNAVVEDPKETVATETTATTALPVQAGDETESNEEEVIKAWKDRQKQLSNDKMFLYFWLPVFVFMLVWMSLKAISYLDTVDSAYFKNRVSAVGSAIVRIGAGRHPVQNPVGPDMLEELAV